MSNKKKKTVFKIIKRKYKSALIKAAHFFDSIKDKKICGCSLVKYIPSLYRETMGATGSEATCYWALDKIFGDVILEKNDSFIDIGCDKGRVLAFMQRKGYSCKITGIELNKDVAEYAQKWASKYDNITILNGNAFELDYNDYSVLFMGRPFETETFYKFIDQLEEKLKRKIRLFYWWDTQSGAYLENRKGWAMIRRDWIYKSHGLYMYHCPQRYTLWEYTPYEE